MLAYETSTSFPPHRDSLALGSDLALSLALPLPFPSLHLPPHI